MGQYQKSQTKNGPDHKSKACTPGKIRKASEHGENEVWGPQSMAICRMGPGVPIFLRPGLVHLGEFHGGFDQERPGESGKSVDVTDWPYTCVILFSYIQST